RALVVERAHAEAGRPQRQLPADLAQPDDAKRGLVQHADLAYARPAADRCMPGAEPARLEAGLSKRFGADPAACAVQSTADVKHYREGMLRAADVGSTPLRAYRNTALVARLEVDAARDDSVLLHHAQLRC